MKMRTFPLAKSFLAGVVMLAAPIVASAGVFLSITVAPPALPVYVQPPCPTDGLIWTPGYWAYGPVGYYWVPGAWVAPPQPGFLWTPAYWGFAGGFYGFHPGYWGPHVGYYGGINYGFGYNGFGYGGGEWRGNRFLYNTAVTRVNTTVVHNTFIDNRVVNNTTMNRTSFNGPGGVTASPRGEELAAERERHIQATASQVQHERFAGNNRAQFASVNHGQPATVAVARPFSAPAQNRPNTPDRGFNQNNARPNVAAQRPAERSVQPGAFAQNRQNNTPVQRAPETPRGFSQGQRPAPQAEFNQRRNAPQPAAVQQNRPQPRPEAPRPEAARPEPARQQARPEPAHHEEGHHGR